MTSIPPPVSSASPSVTMPPRGAPPAQKPAEKKEKPSLGDFFLGVAKKVGLGFVGKLLGKASAPIQIAKAAIELFKVGQPIVADLLNKLRGKIPEKGLEATAAGRAAGSDPALGQHFAVLAHLGGLSALQRAAAEGRLPQDPKALAEIYNAGARAIIEQGLSGARAEFERTGDPNQAFQQVAPYLSDAKVSFRDLVILYDDRRSLLERAQAGASIYNDLTRPQERAVDKAPPRKEEEKTQNKSLEPAKETARDPKNRDDAEKRTGDSSLNRTNDAQDRTDADERTGKASPEETKERQDRAVAEPQLGAALPVIADPITERLDKAFSSMTEQGVDRAIGQDPQVVATDAVRAAGQDVEKTAFAPGQATATPRLPDTLERAIPGPVNDRTR